MLGGDFSLFYGLPIKLDFECIESKVYLGKVVRIILDAQKKILMLTMFKRNNGISVKIITAVIRNRKL